MPRLPEAMIRASDFNALRELLRHGPARRGAFTAHDAGRPDQGSFASEAQTSSLSLRTKTWPFANAGGAQAIFEAENG